MRGGVLERDARPSDLEHQGSNPGLHAKFSEQWVGQMWTWKLMGRDWSRVTPEGETGREVPTPPTPSQPHPGVLSHCCQRA